MRLIAVSLFTASIILLSFLAWSNQQTGMEKRIDFKNTDEAQHWIIVNDTVMGGRSRAKLGISNDMLVFAGELSLQNNGGFASIRRVYDPVQWDSKNRFEVEVVGDGRSYQFRLRTNRNADGIAYVTNFSTKKNKIQTFVFDIADFTPQFRGRIVRGAPALSFSDVEQMGFMLADKNEGPFILQITHVRQISETI